MKEEITRRIAKILKKEEDEIGKLIEIPPNPDLGDYSIPCFSFSKELKKSPQEIANSLSKKIGKMKGMREIKAVGPYLNFFIDEKEFAKSVILDIERKKDKYGSNSEGKGKTAVIDMSSPNIAKPFGIGHLRSTIIGNSVSEIGKFNGYKVIKINYLGDWGTQFGKLIVGFKKFGSESKLKKEKIKHLLDIYVKVSNDENLEDGAREAFKKLESGDK